MNAIESELFEEFKGVDKICRDMLNADKGVTAYIEQMDMTPMYIRNRISGWHSEYKKLKHVRWVRNKLAHETGYVECTVDDVNWLKGFHQRILIGHDPIAIAEQIKRQATIQSSAPRQSTAFVPRTDMRTQERNSSATNIAIGVLCAIGAVGVLVLLFWFLIR